MTIPVVETERLVLRAHRPGDFPDGVAMWTDPVVTRHTAGGKPSTEQQVWSRILSYAGLWSLMGYGYWAVEEKSTGLFVGELGFADFKRGIAALKDVPEAGWALVPRAHGKGYATEGLKAALAWGDARWGSARTGCIIDPGNAPSLRVAEKCGYRELERVTYKDEPTIVFVRPA